MFRGNEKKQEKPVLLKDLLFTSSLQKTKRRKMSLWDKRYCYEMFCYE